jgi:hypothetical protein
MKSGRQANSLYQRETLPPSIQRFLGEEKRATVHHLQKKWDEHLMKSLKNNINVTFNALNEQPISICSHL